MYIYRERDTHTYVVSVVGLFVCMSYVLVSVLLLLLICLYVFVCYYMLTACLWVALPV